MSAINILSFRLSNVDSTTKLFDSTDNLARFIAESVYKYYNVEKFRMYYRLLIEECQVCSFFRPKSVFIKICLIIS